jgi:hypothetical protein
VRLLFNDYRSRVDIICKSFTGVELIRVLLANNIRPILMIAFTNHALDHMLCSVLDAGITQKIVRLGSRSADERISKYSIETLERVGGPSRLNQAFRKNHRDLKDIEEHIKKLMTKYQKTFVDSDEIVQYLEIQHPELFEHLLVPPRWITLIKSLGHSADDNDGAWHRVGGNGRKIEENDDSMYEYWRTGQDLDFLQSRPAPPPLLPTRQETLGHNMFDGISEEVMDSGVNSEQDDTDRDIESDTDGDVESDTDGDIEPWQLAWDSSSEMGSSVDSSPDEELLSAPSPPAATTNSLSMSDFRDPTEFFSFLGYENVPPLPSSNRPVENLLASYEMWSLALSERMQLHRYWTKEVKLQSQQSLQEVLSCGKNVGCN